MGTPANQTAYANKPGRSLLRSIQKMENDILALQNKVDDEEHKTKALQNKAKELQNKAKELQNRVDDQAKELMILRPLTDTAVDIRKRFFATYRRREQEMEDKDHSIINSGNRRAHAGDVCLDVCLFRNHLIEYDHDATFSTLYGLSWLEAESLLEYKQLVYAMNARATTITNSRLWWNPEQESDFRRLLSWISNATADELEKFKEDTDGDTYPQRLFKSMDCMT
jgi:gas vesicle protein